jgi:hypothetical protein
VCHNLCQLLARERRSTVYFGMVGPHLSSRVGACEWEMFIFVSFLPINWRHREFENFDTEVVPFNL